VKHKTNTTALRNVINHHVTRGAALCRQSTYAKSNREYASMMQQAGHHFSVVDDCRRKLWMAERSR
jgi:hypothetical protein